MRQTVHSRPNGGVRSASPLKYLDQLIDIGSSGEERQAGGHFCEYATDGPDVDGGGVAGGAEEEFGGAVPQGDYFVSVWPVREAGEAG